MQAASCKVEGRLAACKERAEAKKNLLQLLLLKSIIWQRNGHYVSGFEIDVRNICHFILLSL